MAGVEVHVGAKTDKAVRELQSFKKKTQGIAKSIAKGFKERVGHRIFDGLVSMAKKIPGIINTAVNTAADLNEEIDKSSVVFQKNAKEIEKFAESAVTSMNVSKLAAMKYTGTLGGLFKTIGMNSEQTMTMSKRMVQLAADLGSLHNKKTEDAIQAIGSALRGEAEPIRVFNVLLNDMTLKTEAMARGLYDGKGALDPATKALAAYHVILRQTTDAHGNAEATAYSYQNQKKKLTAEIENLSGEIGKTFLPLMRDMVTTMNKVDFESIAEHAEFAARGFKLYAEEIAEAKKQVESFLETIPGIEKLKDIFQDFFPGTKKVELLPDPLKDNPPEYLKENNEVTQGEQFLKVLKEVEERERKKIETKLKNIQFQEEENARMKEHDEMLKAGIHAERERLEILEKQREEKEKALALEKAQEGIDRTMEQVGEIQSGLNSAMTRSSITAVSSMQAIGGGGGVSGELNLQKTQTDLQRQLVVLNKELVDAFREQAQLSKQPVSQ